MSDIANTVAAPKASKSRKAFPKSKALASVAPSALEVQASKRSAFAAQIVEYAKADIALGNEFKARKLTLLADLVAKYGPVDQTDWKTWLKDLFAKAFGDLHKVNLSALAPVVVALSRGLKPKPGQGFDSFRETALAWARKQPDTVYKVQEKTKTEPAPAGTSTQGATGNAQPKGKVTWTRAQVIGWLAGENELLAWALENVMAHAGDKVFLDALEKEASKAETRNGKPRARPS